MSAEYKRAVHRVAAALELTDKLWDNSPDIQRDMFPEHEALQAWIWIPGCYSLIEQAFKLLWATREGVPVERVKNELIKTLPRRAQAHNLNMLFEKLTPDDREKIDHAYRAYQSLHDYIPIFAVKDFLSKTGDGYTRWRYLLLEGMEGIPTAHIGAMLEIAGACVTILTNAHFTDHGFHTVDQRIDWAVRNAIGGEVRRYVIDYQQQRSLDSEEFQEICKRRKRYVVELFNKEVDLAHAILSDETPSHVDTDSEDFALVRRICQALSATDKKNSRQYVRRRLGNRSH